MVGVRTEVLSVVSVSIVVTSSPSSAPVTALAPLSVPSDWNVEVSGALEALAGTSSAAPWGPGHFLIGQQPGYTACSSPGTALQPGAGTNHGQLPTQANRSCSRNCELGTDF